MRPFVVALGMAMIMPLQPAAAQPSTLPKFLMACAACHGFDGIGNDRSIPNLAGQSRDYLATQLRAFRDGRRQHPTMNFFAVQATREELQQIVDYYTALPRP